MSNKMFCEPSNHYYYHLLSKRLLHSRNSRGNGKDNLGKHICVQGYGYMFRILLWLLSTPVVIFGDKSRNYGSMFHYGHYHVIHFAVNAIHIKIVFTTGVVELAAMKRYTELTECAIHYIPNKYFVQRLIIMVA